MSVTANHVVGLVGVALIWVAIGRCLWLIQIDHRRQARVRPAAPLEPLDLDAARRRRRRTA